MNIKDIAKLAGVSTSTVSKIVNHKDSSITEATRNKVLDLVKKYHYTPYASSKPNTTSWRIGVLLSSSISLDSTLDGIIQQAQASGYGTLVFNSYSSHEQEEQNIQAAIEHRVDGIIWEPIDKSSLKLNKTITAKKIPELIIGPLGDDRSALLPYEEAAYNLTQELMDRNHSNIACLLSPGRRTQSFLRGYRRCLFENNIAFHNDMVFYDIDDNLTTVMENRHVTGFVASHYRHAVELQQYAQSLHYRLPQDFSLVTLRNDSDEPLHYPGIPEISSYNMRNADFGTHLCSRLINTIEHNKAEQTEFKHLFILDNEHTISQPPNMRHKKIVVIGSINVDTYLATPTLPKPGMTVTTRNFASTPGGKATNQAVGVAKLGHHVSLIGNVGNDISADFIYQAMNRFHVDTTGVMRIKRTDTGKAYIFVDNNGESMISLVSGANSTLAPDDIDGREHIFSNTAYCLIQTEIPLEAVKEACMMAKKHHAITILKPSSCSHLPDNILNLIDILVPNQNEIETLFPQPGSIVEKAQYSISKGVGTVIVTLADQGCVLVTENNHKHFPAEQTRVIDDTGAGDAFISCLAACLLENRTLEEAVRIANLAAGFSVAHEGAIPSLISRGQLKSLLA